ncbi:MAG: DSD1 family PLP-dependent enzyme [Rhodospirillales bacterium]|nr:DSD1 family PLP-dependent enzyme [Rhodospirillales bacterium]
MTASEALGPNESLIDGPESRARLITPALVLDLDAMERNIATMAAYAAEQGVAIRPHAKTHKSVQIARRQLDAGALGICCATLGEAEALAAGGIEGLLITSPVVAPAKIDRLMALRRDNESLMVSADDMDNLRALEGAAAASGLVLDMVIDVDVGLHRTGTRDAKTAVAMAEAADASDSLRFRGLQGYAGHVQHIEDFGDRRTTSHGDLTPLREARDSLVERGVEVPIVTGAGTGTHDIDIEIGLMTELQVGSYVVMDVEYLDVQTQGGGDWRFEPALFVRSTVVSASHDGSATMDAGLKCFATDGPTPRFHTGVPIGAHYKYFGDEHGCIVFASANERLAIGAALECIVPHCDPTVNLYDHYHCVRGETLVDIWPIEARGRH